VERRKQPCYTLPRQIQKETESVNALTGEPIVGARVSTTGMSSVDLYVVRTDAAGHFRLTCSQSIAHGRNWRCNSGTYRWTHRQMVA